MPSARSGGQVRRLAAVPGLSRLARHEEADFLFEVFTLDPSGTGSVSVARREGLV
jgi:hypothetical protein